MLITRNAIITRCVWRYEPGARGRRHRHPFQEETFVVLGTLTMYLGDEAQRHDVPTGGLIHGRAAHAPPDR